MEKKEPVCPTIATTSRDSEREGGGHGQAHKQARHSQQAPRPAGGARHPDGDAEGDGQSAGEERERGIR